MEYIYISFDLLSITFQSPGQVDTNENSTDLTDLPASFSGTDVLCWDDLTIASGTDVKDVVSFKLLLQFNDDNDSKAFG
jgi:hypothetical protein